MRLRNPFIRKEVISSSDSSSHHPSDNHDAIEAPSPSSQTPLWVGAVLSAVIAVLIFVTLIQYQANSEMAVRLEETSALLRGVELRTGQLESSLVELQQSTEATTADLETTSKELKQARAATWKLRKDHSQTAQQINAALAEHQEQLASIDEEVTEVRDEVSVTQDALADTRTELGRAVGDLGLQSGLIARNQEELEELKRRGEREYVEFDIRKSKQYTRVGDLAIRLNKTDRKRSKFTLTVLQNDRNIEKKDRTLYEPVQFYTGQKGRLLELVVFTLEKDRVAGYLSLPKEQLASNAPVR